MSTDPQINQRGTFTIPEDLRERYGMERQAILEETPNELTLRPAATGGIQATERGRSEGLQVLNPKTRQPVDRRFVVKFLGVGGENSVGA
jgi:bifunctional DNA-binding transcriptional regulator/antitoxin component of YhaV-PrlF toxin-antitoxin module